MRLRQLQGRLVRLERLASEQRDAERQFTIDQKLADHYLELKSRLDRLCAEHKAGHSVDVAYAMAIWKEMNDIRMTNHLPSTEVGYRCELRVRASLLAKREADPNYLPLTPHEKLHLRQLTLLCHIEAREILQFPPGQFDNTATEQEIGSALFRYEKDLKWNPQVKEIWAQYPARLEKYKIK